MPQAAEHDKMFQMSLLRRAFAVALGALAAGLLCAAPASAQVQPCPKPARQPPADSPVLLRCVQWIFHPDDSQSVDIETYRYYMNYIGQGGSDSTQNHWVPYKEDDVVENFDRLWKTKFLDDLWIEVIDEPYDNGIAAKHVIYHMEERERLKVVDYTGSKKVEISKIEDAYKEHGLTIKFDTFVDEAVIRQAKGIIQQLYAEKGFQYAKIDVEKSHLPGGPKLLRLTFNVDEGPEVQISELFFDGNHAFSDHTLARQMKDNKARNWLSFITSAGQFQEAKFDDDAQRIQQFYENHGYARARVGAPQLETLRDSADGKKRQVRLRIPVDEGERYKFGKIDVSGNTALKADFLRSLFKIQDGEYYSHKKIAKGYEKAKQAYGSFGYMDLNLLPELNFRGIDPETGKPTAEGPLPNIVDLTLRFDEGKQYFVNRITFVGNTTTHDTVVRRDMRVYEGGIFNAEALKESVRRINQLGYFKPMEKEDAMQVTKTPDTDNKVDINLKVEEQNRNSLSFGAGISQFEGFFGQLSFQTANFLGRGETIGVSLQKGVQARNYQVSFSEPYVFDRPISAGVDVFSRQYVFPLEYTQNSTGTNFVLGFPLADYTRAFLGYSYEKVSITDINSAFLTPAVINASPYLKDSLLQNQGGQRKVSKVSPSFVFNTVNQPIFPTQGKRMTAGFDVAGLGGNTDYLSTNLEAIYYHQFTTRTSIGMRAQSQYIRPYGRTSTLPIFEKFFMGGEYSVRGFDIRSIGPRDPTSGLVVGGNKTLLFNAEYAVNVGGPVRALAFYDAGQVKDIGQSFTWWDPVVSVTSPPLPLLIDPFATGGILVEPGAIKTIVTGKASAFKTSMGGEVRFFMPVLNVPFRLIAAYNPQRYGVLDNNLQPAKKFTFRFAVGTTF